MSQNPNQTIPRNDSNSLFKSFLRKSRSETFVVWASSALYQTRLKCKQKNSLCLFIIFFFCTRIQELSDLLKVFNSASAAALVSQAAEQSPLLPYRPPFRQIQCAHHFWLFWPSNNFSFLCRMIVIFGLYKGPRTRSSWATCRSEKIPIFISKVIYILMYIYSKTYVHNNSQKNLMCTMFFWACFFDNFLA